ncbi:DUF2085 domain-containing protein [Bacillus sp. 31A1R]|uniref:DUF2085 domain-containing protein n=1 Tax=Robertmurraya mangrovi TaxID=3098077 RepID=A0ABU5J5I4_9BACI|nr:DUF2085 domain-containing protein [Bacillus sp. 31A1R]MDZ5474641.1 DUF2085 domain-containing protein [Bacillus sp. 31A1R]
MSQMLKEIITLKFMPCHRKRERSLTINGWQFPVCYRCMFILIGYLFTPVFLVLPPVNSIISGIMMGILLTIPMIIDGYTQLKGLRISTNFLRIITGLTAGMGMSFIIVYAAKGLITLMFRLI